MNVLDPFQVGEIRVWPFDLSGQSKRRLELELCASWVVSQKIAKGTKSVVVFAAFCWDHGQSSFPQFCYGGREHRRQVLHHKCINRRSLSDFTAGSSGSQSRRCPEAHRRGQPLQSEARSAKNAPESAICGVLPNRPAPTGSVLWLVPISFPRSAPRRVGWTNLPLSDCRPPPPCRAEAPRRRVPSSFSEAPLV